MIDLILLCCSDTTCESTSCLRLELRVPRGILPSLGTCPMCKMHGKMSPWKLIGRVELQSADETREGALQRLKDEIRVLEAKGRALEIRRIEDRLRVLDEREKQP